MDVVVWNMQHRKSNWGLLRDGADLGADVHILCEATKPPKGVSAIGEWRTIGLEEGLPLDRVRCERRWSTGVAARSELACITDARMARGYERPALLPFRPSRPGTWTATQVNIGGTHVTVVALYGLMDEMSDASVHRSLSELSPIFDHPRYGRYLLLGGDLNVPANMRPSDHPGAERAAAVLARLGAYGLESCVDRPERTDEDPAFTDCPCGEDPCMRHRRTFRRTGAAAYQEDYLFASSKLFKKVESCSVLPFLPSSDHAPIRASFAV